MKLTTDIIRRLIKEELSLFESQYGEEFNPQMELPKGHKGKKNNEYLSYEDDKNHQIYQSYVDQLKKHSWTIDMIIEGALEMAKTQIERAYHRHRNFSEDERWIKTYLDILGYEDEKNNIKYHIGKGIIFNIRAQIKQKKKEQTPEEKEQEKKEHFPIPEYLDPWALRNILVEENPDNLNNDILNDVKRMFYFIKDLHQGKLPYKPEAQEAIKNNKETFNQAFSSYDGPSPEDSYEGKDIF